MPNVSRRFDFCLAGRRLAQAQTIPELERGWLAVQKDFEAHWGKEGHVLLFLIHDDYGSISDNDVADLVGKIEALEARTPIDIILHTHGGYVSPTHMIAGAPVSRPNTAAFVPFLAKSGGTLIALATQKVHMGKVAALGPVDLQIGGWSAREIVKLVKELGDEAAPELKLIARDAEKALKDETKKINRLINRRHKGFLGWRGSFLAKALTSGDMHHGETISLKDAKRLHIRVKQNVPKSVYGLISLRLEQLRRLRELEAQGVLVQLPAAAAE
ncbi:MAG: hypothetical protein KGJ49_00235 [Alphaproteobacteria bacterium]|nr:hypothetical protein [Alphaproteobacteria bacterium]